jgi:hypothetical protein
MQRGSGPTLTLPLALTPLPHPNLHPNPSLLFSLFPLDVAIRFTKKKMKIRWGTQLSISH